MVFWGALFYFILVFLFCLFYFGHVLKYQLTKHFLLQLHNTVLMQQHVVSRETHDAAPLFISSEMQTKNMSVKKSVPIKKNCQRMHLLRLFSPEQFTIS